MKIKKRVICGAVILSMAVNYTTVFGGCGIFERFGLLKKLYGERLAEEYVDRNVNEEKIVEEVANEGEDSLAQEVLEIVNEYRAEEGLSPLTMNEDALKAANVRAEEISRSFSHTRPDGRRCFSALEEVGIRNKAMGENIAYGYRTPQEVMTGWMNSPGHRANILQSGYKELGVGIYRDSDGKMNWVQLFVG